jgi:catechol 2,3-dioxygenase-like lactoylglutathione lyase family enzyme
MTSSEPTPAPDIVALRTFLPAKDFEQSLQFYKDLGFSARMHGSSLATMQLGPFGFLLQEFYVQQHAGNFMMHMTVNDLDEWWRRIQALDLPAKYGVRAPTPPALQPWGLTLVYVVDPTGVLWHIAQNQG